MSSHKLHPRDMTRQQFRDALKQRGWRSILGWIDVGNGLSIGMIYHGIPMKPNYRASLAKAIRRSKDVES